MDVAIIVQVVCTIYFIIMAYIGFMFGWDYLKTYPWTDPRHGVVSMILLVAAFLFLGPFPFTIVGCYALALIQTRQQEKRKGGDK